LKTCLRITNAGGVLYEGLHEIRDAESFGAACRQAWDGLRARRLDKATSIGALYDVLSDNVLDLLQGAVITVNKAEEG